MTTSVDLRLLAVDALKDATTAGANVYSPRDLATWDGDYPMLVVTAPQEDGQGWGASVRRSSMSQRRCVFWGAYSGPLKKTIWQQRSCMKIWRR